MSKLNKDIAVIGYSGHAYVAIDILLSASQKVTAYCDAEEKEYNPFSLQYLGKEADARITEVLKRYDYFIAIGDNAVRSSIYKKLLPVLGNPVNAIHPTAVISPSVKMKDGIFAAANISINPFVQIGTGVICNTSCSIDHECVIGNFAHIAPGAILCGNVKVGDNSFIGAGSVVKQGVKIGNNVMIGAGCVVIKDVENNCIMIGNPQKRLNNK
jgi:sugar O-acyltransferase (sialic acid O-acetyltransferase NeuD family)